MRNATHATQDLSIEVMPLPTDGKPADFSGAVGTFTAELKADKTEVAANTPVNLTLNFSGTGNFAAIDAPKISFPPDFELYETTSPTRSAIRSGGRKPLESEKTYQYVVIPRKAGKFVIPEKNWSYFDPKKGSYQAITINGVSVNVTENANLGVLPSNPSNSSANANMSSVKDESIRYLKSDTSSFSKFLQALFKLALPVLGLANLLLFAMWLWPKRAKILALAPKSDPFTVLLEKTSAISKSNSAQWLGDVEELLFEALEIRLGTNPRGLTRSELEDVWKNRALNGKLFFETSGLLDLLDQARFSNQNSAEAKQQLRIRVLPSLKKLLEEFRKTRS